MTIQPKIITVFGATGNQGGAVVRSLLKNPEQFHVRAITRNTDTRKAQKLKLLGADLIQADGWHKDEIRDAFAGSWAAFVNTNSEDPLFLQTAGPTEFDLGRTIVDGLIAANVKYLVYSSFVSANDFTHGKIKMNTMDMKNRTEKYALESGHFNAVCSLHAGWFLESFLIPDLAKLFGGFPLFADDEGYITIRTPRWDTETDCGVPWVCIEDDFGDIVHGIFLNPDKYHTEIIPAVSDVVSFPELAAIFQKVTGKRARYIPLPSCADFGRGIPEVEDHRLLFEFAQLTNAKYFGNEPVQTNVAESLKRDALKAQRRNAGNIHLSTVLEWCEKTFKLN